MFYVLCITPSQSFSVKMKLTVIVKHFRGWSLPQSSPQPVTHSSSLTFCSSAFCSSDRQDRYIYVCPCLCITYVSVDLLCHHLLCYLLLLTHSLTHALPSLSPGLVIFAKRCGLSTNGQQVTFGLIQLLLVNVGRVVVALQIQLNCFCLKAVLRDWQMNQQSIVEYISHPQCEV